MADRRRAAGLCAVLLLAGACSSGGSDGDSLAAEGTTQDDVTTTTADPLALIQANRCDTSVNPPTYYEEAEAYGVDVLTGSFESVASMGEIMDDRDEPEEADDGHAHEHAEEMPADHGDMSAEDHADMAEEMPADHGDMSAEEMPADHSDMSAEDHADMAEEMPADHGDMSAEDHADHEAAGGEGHEGASDDTGHGGHAGPQPWEAMTDDELCSQLEGELDHAYEVAMRYPTIADAKAAGFHLVTPYVSGMGSHLMNFGWVDEEFDIEEPEMLLFDGNIDESRIVGLSYYVIKPGVVEPEVGFTGPNDRYHRHLGLCIKNGMVIGPESMSEEACTSVGGSKSNGEGAWMQHTWVIPGCESPWGMFSGLNPVLDWEVVTETGKPGTEGCAASERDLDMRAPGGEAPTSG